MYNVYVATYTYVRVFPVIGSGPFFLIYIDTWGCEGRLGAGPAPNLAMPGLSSFNTGVKCELDSLHASEAWDEGLEWESYQFGRTVFSTSAGLEHELE